MKILKRDMEEAPSFEPTPSALRASRRQVIGKSADTVLSFRKSIYDMGHAAATAAMDTRENQQVMQSVLGNAEGMAREQAAKLLDPEKSLHDDLRRKEHETALALIPKLNTDIAEIAEDVRRRRDAAAEMGDSPIPPRKPWFLIICALLLIGGTVAPTLHDFFFADMPDPRLGWVLSVATGSLAGMVISWSLVGMAAFTSQTGRWVGLTAGLLFSVALAVIRMVGGNGHSAFILAVGLGLLEIAAVLLLDWIGNGLRRQHLEFEKRSIEHARRARVLQAAEAEFTYRERLMREERKIVDQYVEDVGDREGSAAQLEDLVRGAVQAARNGYYAGLAELQGRLHGRDS